MASAVFFKEYIFWHYGHALIEIYELGKNFLWFGYHFFSIPLLLKTLLSPFLRLKERSPQGTFDPATIMGNVIVNTIMRLVGLILRTAVLSIGLVFEAAVFFVSLTILVIWIFLPFLLAILLLTGVISLF